MKKIILTLAALAALSTASFAERHWDLRDTPESQGTISTSFDNAGAVSGVELLAAPTFDTNSVSAIDEITDAHGFKR
jgi:hypothetical protein